MDVRTELPQDSWVTGERLERAEPAEIDSVAASSSHEAARHPSAVATRQVLEEASFLVVESGRIRFFVRPRVEAGVPLGVDDVECVSFTLTPRNRSVVRRVSLSERSLPDTRVRERRAAHVDHVGSAGPATARRGARPYARRARGARTAAAIEVASGTYAITSHRDHTHLMYELDGESAAISATLLRRLHILPRASYVAVVQNPESRWRLRDHVAPVVSERPRRPGRPEPRRVDDLGDRRCTPLDPVFLDHEGTELVLIGGGQSERDQRDTWARS
ncbi:MAG: hypothetical protein KF764_08240 [Labilithrix sp.]|nr:hypothetical protein [Labilithrix sp.]MBX3221145.1 hypothetical protein [Labilithrix sp.]